VEWFKVETLSSNPSTAKKKKKREREREINYFLKDLISRYGHTEGEDFNI
jgi:hypothetical protein